MERIFVTPTATGLNIDGIPDGVKVVQVTDPKAHRMADMCLHHVDLAFAYECLAALKQVQPSKFHQEVFWRCAIVHYFKCFSASRNRKVRRQLSADAVYRGEPSEAMQNFLYFKNLRNKHLVHDENTYSQGLPCAVLNDGSKSYKIEKIVSLSIQAISLEQNEFGNFEMLITKAIEYVSAQIDSCCRILTAELEKKTYAELSALPQMNFELPLGGNIAVDRKRPR